MSDGKPRIAIVVHHQDPAAIDALDVTSRRTVEDALNSIALQAVPDTVRAGWMAGEGLRLAPPDAPATIELVPREQNWTHQNLSLVLAREVRFLGQGFALETNIESRCRPCGPHLHCDRVARRILFNGTPWTIETASPVAGAPLRAQAFLEIELAFDS